MIKINKELFRDSSLTELLDIIEVGFEPTTNALKWYIIADCSYYISFFLGGGEIVGKNKQSITDAGLPQPYTCWGVGGRVIVNKNQSITCR